MSARLLVDDAPAPAAGIDPGRRRLGLLIWALLFFNGMAFSTMPLLVPIPGAAAKLVDASVARGGNVSGADLQP